MCHTSAKSTFGGGEKIFGGKKSSRGRQKPVKKPVRKTEKIVATFFYILFLRQ